MYFLVVNLWLIVILIEVYLKLPYIEDWLIYADFRAQIKK